MSDVRPRFEADFTSSCRFSITEQMVTKFAALTGDQSALHVSESFARRSTYRQPVAHGMLPVAFLALVKGFRVNGLEAVIREITGRFSNPVYIGDSLELRVNLAKDQISDAGTTFEYHIRKTSTEATVTNGVLILDHQECKSEQPGQAAEGTVSPCLLTERVQALRLGPDDISKGRRERLAFDLAETKVKALHAILTEGMGNPSEDDPPPSHLGFRYTNLSTVALLSTLVGMRLPGDFATFLEFSVQFEENVEQDISLCLDATVTHFSRSTNILKTAVTVYNSSESGSAALAKGKVAALVNPSPRAMPTIKEIASSAMDYGLHLKTALITGASRGIGETIAKLLALHGAQVIVNYRQGKDDANKVVNEIKAAGGTAVAIQADVTKPEEVENMVREAKARFGTIQILVNSAVRDYRPTPFLDLRWADIQADMEVMAMGAFNTCQATIPLMLEAGGGKIVNISSVAVDKPPPDQTKYVMAKSALVGLTRSLSVEFAAKNIQANLVVPSFVETDLVSHIGEGFRSKIARDTPMQRHASPVEVAQAVLFLVSSHASFTTGQKLMVTGGGTPYL